jgi:glycosyltransferase involved in cell wall biosynthesis
MAKFLLMRVAKRTGHSNPCEPSPRQVRVAIVSDAIFPWHKGGKEARYYELLKRLPRHGLDVTVYTMKWWKERPIDGEYRHRAICPRMALYSGERRSVFQAVIFSLATLQLLFRTFDVIEADQMPLLQLFPLRLVSWIKRVDLVVGWHEVWGASYWREYLGGFGIVASSLEKMAARTADRLLPVTSDMVPQLQAMGVKKERITVIPNGVDRSRLSAIQSADDAPELLFVGRLLSHKRCDLAIRALAIIHSNGITPRLGVVGVGPELQRLTSLAFAHQMTKYLDFHGGVENQEDLWRTMKGAKVLICPSEREGFGLTVAESLALGTPVISTGHRDNMARLLVDDGLTGSIVPAGDPTALASAVCNWLLKDEDSAVIASRFWRGHAHLDWDLAAAEYAVQLGATGGLPEQG